MQWVEPDVREQVIGFVNLYREKTSLPVNCFIGKLGISSSKYYSWIGRQGQLNKHNGRLPKKSFIDSSFIPVSYNLFNPFPNPFNPSATVVFDLPEKSFVSIKLYSITGEEVRTIVNERLDAGRYPFLIDGNNLSAGVYLLRMISNNYVSTKKIIMMK